MALVWTFILLYLLVIGLARAIAIVRRQRCRRAEATFQSRFEGLLREIEAHLAQQEKEEPPPNAPKDGTIVPRELADGD